MWVLRTNVQTKEDIRFKKQQRASWAAIIVALLVGIGSIVQNCQNTSSMMRHQEKIDNMHKDATVVVSQYVSDSLVNLPTEPH